MPPPLLDDGTPSPDQRHPMPGHPRVGFLKALCTRPTIEVGDYSYYDDPDGPERFQDHNVLYHHDFVGDRLVIGRFCALAAGTTFIMSGANHPTRGISTFPFPIFGGAWAAEMDRLIAPPRDTVIGHDVWFGWRTTILPGVTIGSGAIIAAGAVVHADVPPYAVVAGNPGRVVKTRFSDADIARLLAVAWWDWPIDKVTRNVGSIMDGDITALEAAT